MRTDRPAALPRKFVAVSVAWLLAVGMASAETLVGSLSHPPGRYPAGIELAVGSSDDQEALFAAFAGGSSGEQLPRFALRESLALTALPGEERRYQIQLERHTSAGVETVEVDYTIDRRPPAAPRFSPPSGTYHQAVEVLLTGTSVIASPGDAPSYRFAVGAHPLVAGALWDGTAIPLAVAEGEVREYQIHALAQDAVGNRSRIVVADYVIDTKHLAPPQLTVLSPVAGVFGNRQQLVIEAENVDWIRYSLDGRDPVANGLEYVGSVELSLTGPIQLRVAAKPTRAATGLLRHAVDLAVQREEAPSVVTGARGGIVREGFEVTLVSPLSAQLYYSLDDKTPDGFDVRYTDPIQFAGFHGSRKFIPLRVRAVLGDDEWGVEHRLLFDLDNRVPDPPRMSTRAEGGQVTVNLAAQPNVAIYYTSDSTQPRLTSTLYTAPFAVAPGATVRAVAVSRAAVLSATASQDAFASTAGAIGAPVVAVVSAPGDEIGITAGGVELAVSVAAGAPADTRIHLEVAGVDESAAVRLPTVDSAVAPARLRVALPRGDRRELALRFVAVAGTGQASAPTDLALRLDRSPPGCALPSATTIAGSAGYQLTPGVAAPVAVHYSLSEDGSDPADPSFQSPVLDRLTLSGRADDLVLYRLKIVCRTALGNASDVLTGIEFSVDRRLPRVPVLRGFQDGSLYANREIAFDFRQESSLALHYEVTTDGSDPTEPSIESPLLTPTTAFAGIDGETTEFRIRILPVASSGQRGPPETVTFVVDRGVPEPPFLAGFADGAVYSRPVAVSAVSPALGNRLYLAVMRGAPAEQLIAPQHLYTGAIELDVEAGGEATFFVESAEVDDAGNLSERVAAQFGIDRKPPKPPTVRGVPESGLSSQPALVQLGGSSPNILYELTSDGSTPRLPSLGSEPYTEPLALAGRAGVLVTYQLRVRAIDAVGNMSEPGPIFTVTIDRVSPLAPPAPEVTPQIGVGGAAGAGLLLSWGPAVSADIEFAIVAGGGAAAAPLTPAYTPYTGPLLLAAPDAGGGEVWARRVDAAGNLSPVVRTPLAQQAAVAAPRVTGVETGVVYREAVAAAFLSDQGRSVRVEVATGGGQPPAVGRHSRLAAAPLIFDAMLGETVDYAVRARAFNSAGVAVSPESRIDFTVDRTPPAPPILLGAEDGSYYAEGVEVTLLSSEGNIRYALARSSSVSDLQGLLPPVDEYGVYGDALTLAKEPGQITAYLLAAYVVEEVGNSSTGLVRWRVTIDDRVVYVSSRGDDDNPGTRTRPLLTLERAVATAQRTGKREIRVAAGEYVLERPLVVGGDLAVVGGFDETNWDGRGVERFSTLLPGRFFGPGDPLLHVAGGQISVSSLLLSDRGAPPKMPVILVSGGELELDASQLTVTGVGGVALRIDGGFVRVLGSALAAAPQGAPLALIRQRGGALLVARSTLRGPARGDEFTAISISDTDDVTLDRVTIRPGAAERTVGVRAVRSQLTVAGGLLLTGSGSRRAVALSVENSGLTVVDAELQAQPLAAYPIAVEARDARVEIRGSQIRLAAALGSTGVRLRGSELQLEAVTITAAASSEFTFLLDAEASSGMVQNSILVAGDAGESAIANLAAASIDWVNNTLVAGAGRTLTVGLRLAGGSQPRLANNILIRRRAASSRAVALLADQEVTELAVVANNLAGWDALLAAPLGAAPAARRGATDPGLSDAELADQLNLADGNPFGGRLHGNLGEAFESTFVVSKRADLAGTYQLAEDSGSINGGVAFSSGVNSPARDFLGRARPAPFIGTRPAPDLGALERY